MKLTLSSIQWTLFILAGSIVAPLAIGAAFGFTQEETALLLQRTFFMIGIASLLQVLFGHKLPIIEGPAGLWWGVFIIYANLAVTKQDAFTTLQYIQLGILISGGLFIALSLLNLISTIKKIFTPIVTGTYLILLVAQLSGSFMNGLLGINYLSEEINYLVAGIAFFVLILTIILANQKNKLIQSYSVLISLMIGWLLFVGFGLTKDFETDSMSWVSFPQLFAWGFPKFSTGIILTSIVTALLLLANLIATVDVSEKAIGYKTKATLNQSGLVMGVNQILSSIFSTIGLVPLSITAGFISATKMRKRLPFIIGSICIVMISFFPIVTLLFASIPAPVGYATMFLAFAKMIGFGLKEYASTPLQENELFIIGMSLMVGIGSMFIPFEAIQAIPPIFQSLLNNGLVLGVVTCIFLEQFMIFRYRSN